MLNNSIRLDTVLYGSAVVAERLLGFLLLPLLTKSISPEEYGAWSQVIVSASVLVPVVTLGLSTSVIKFFPGKALQQRLSLAMAMLLTISGAYAVLAGLMLWSAPFVAQVALGDSEMFEYVQIIVLLLASEAGFDFLLAWLRSQGLMKRIAIYLLARGALRYGVVLLLLHHTDLTFTSVLLAFVLAQAGLIGLLYLLEMRFISGVRFILRDGVTDLGEVIGFSLPLVLISVFTLIQNFSDRFVLTQLLGLHDLAVYSAAASVMAICSIFYSVLGFTLFPILAGLWVRSDIQGCAAMVGRVLQVFLFFSLPVVLGITAISHILMPLLTTDAYRPGWAVFLLLGGAVIGLGFYQIVLYVPLLAGETSKLLKLTLSVAVLNLLLNLFLVPLLGLIGAAASAAASSAVLAAWCHGMVRRMLPIRIPWRHLVSIGVKAAFSSTFLLLLCSLLNVEEWLELFAAVAAVATFYVMSDYFSKNSVTKMVLGK